MNDLGMRLMMNGLRIRLVMNGLGIRPLSFSQVSYVDCSMKLSVATYERGSSTHSMGWGKLSFQTACTPHKKRKNFFSKCFISLVIGIEQAQTLETKEGGLNVWRHHFHFNGAVKCPISQTRSGQ